MTSKVEQKFFECFGIEPKYIEGENTMEYSYGKLEYPPITDRVLLELICIANKECIYGYSDYGGCYLIGETIEEIKESLLTDLIHNKTKVYKQVQQLFKGHK